MNFKEYYLEEASKGYFPTIPAIAKAARKAAPKVARAAGKTATAPFRAAKDLYKDREAYFPTAHKAARAVKDMAFKDYAPEYQNQFAHTPSASSTGASPWVDKSGQPVPSQVAAKNVLKWRTDNITSKQGTPAAAKAFDQLNVAAGRMEAPNIKFQDSDGNPYPSGGFHDMKYDIKVGGPGKVFKDITHYANQVLDSMLVYQRNGYPLDQIKRFLSFDPVALRILEENGMFLVT